MTTVFCSIPHLYDGTSLYRGAGPMHTLSRAFSDIQVGINPEFNWPNLKGADIVFLQRPTVDDQIPRMCKMNGKPLWIDYDDNLHAIPLCNRRHEQYSHPQIQHNIATLVALADVVTASTPHLASSLANLLKCFPKNHEFNLDPEKIVVIPNAYDREIHPALDGTREDRNRLVVWRGSDSHCKDLMLYTPALASVIRENQDWTYEFIGQPFWWTIEELRKVAKPGSLVTTPSQDPVKFFHYLKKQRPALVVVPLEDQAFNRSKSNIAMIEATCAGAITLAPDWEEWRKPGVICYTDPEDFVIKMNSFLSGDFDSQALWGKNAAYILENLGIGRVNKLRYEIIRRLVK